jgi:hypothetical protein
MPNRVGFVDNSVVLAHYAMLAEIKDFCEDNGWSILRYDTVSAERELIMSAPGYIGPDGAVPAYVGVKTYQSVPSDYYNLTVAGFTGYVSGNTFATQPGAYLCGVPAHNQRIDYWMTINDRRLAFGMKVGTPVYESAYIGYLLPYATPRQYPYPLVVGGMLTGEAATRFSDATHSMPYKGARANFVLRSVLGSWLQPSAWFWSEGFSMRPNNDVQYPVQRTILYDASNVYGELDGIFQVSGFNNLVENTMVIGGENYIILQDVARTGFNDYYAMRLDP